MLQASEVQEVQVQVEEEQEKARTLESIVASLRSDLLLAREEQERLQERLHLQEKEAVEREVVVKAALSKVRTELVESIWIFICMYNCFYLTLIVTLYNYNQF